MALAFLAIVTFPIWPINSLLFLIPSQERDDRINSKDYAALIVVAGICLIEFGLGLEIPTLNPWWKIFWVETAKTHYLTGAAFYLYLTPKTIRKWLE